MDTSFKDIEVSSFADDTTPIVNDLDLNTTLNKLAENSGIALTWFKTNYIKLNIDKCHLLVAVRALKKCLLTLEITVSWKA